MVKAISISIVLIIWTLSAQARVQRIDKSRAKNAAVNLYRDGGIELLQERAVNQWNILVKRAQTESNELAPGGAAGMLRAAINGVVPFEESKVYYLPIESTVSGQTRVAYGAVVKKVVATLEESGGARESSMERTARQVYGHVRSIWKGEQARGSVHLDDREGLWVPSYQEGAAVYSKTKPLQGYLVKDKKGKNRVVVVDGNHKNMISLVFRGSKVPVLIKGDLRDLPRDQVIAKLIELNEIYPYGPGGVDLGIKTVDDLISPAELENDDYRFKAALLSTKFFKTQSSVTGRTRLQVKKMNNPKAKVWLKLVGDSPNASVNYVEFMLADYFYKFFMDEDIRNSPTYRKKIKKMKFKLDLKPTKRNLPKIAEVAREILSYYINKGELKPKDLGIVILDGSTPVQEWWKLISNHEKGEDGQVSKKEESRFRNLYHGILQERGTCEAALLAQ